MSRLMKPEEIDGFEKQYGYKPTAVRVAVDGLGVFVNKDNPLERADDAAGRRDLLEDAQGRQRRTTS